MFKYLYLRFISIIFMQKGEETSCISYTFISIFGQSCIYNPTGKIQFRHNRLSATTICCKIDQLAKLCYFSNILGFLSGKTKDKKDQKASAAGAAKIALFLSVLISRRESKRMCNCLFLKLLGWCLSPWHYALF